MGKHETEERYEAQQQEERHEFPGIAALAEKALLAAFSAAFHTTGATVLTASLLRTIGNSYGSMCFAYGPQRHPASIVALRKAMDAYVAVRPSAEPLLFPDSPLGEQPASKPQTVNHYRVLMETIRAAYWKKRQTLHDGAAFDALADDGRGYDPERHSLKNVVDALVRVSPKAKQLNARYFGGRFS